MKKFVASYSGGKDSILAIHRAIKQGYEPVMLVITYNTDKNRSWFHGIPKEVLDSVSKALDIPIKIVKTSGEKYAENFEKALAEAKELGADFCVFGDIDIEEHKTWCVTRCENVNIDWKFPLWQESRKGLVNELIDEGYTANITVVNNDMLPNEFLGKKLTKGLLEKIEKCGADVCGENGEYHTFVSAGPLFKDRVDFCFGEVINEKKYGIMPILFSKRTENSYKFFSNRECVYFPCHKVKDENKFNCLFCYCPLYLKEKCVGNPKYIAGGIKDCSDCLVPHRPENYEMIVKDLFN